MCFSQVIGIVLALYTEMTIWQLCILICVSIPAVEGCVKVSENVFSAADGKENIYYTEYYKRKERERRGRIVLLCVLFMLLGFCRAYNEKHSDGNLKEYEGNIIALEGTVVSAKVKNGYSALTVRVFTENGTDRKGSDEKVLVRLDTLDVEYVYSLPGRTCSFQGEISLPDGRRNPGCFDYAQYLKARKINVICSVSEFRFCAGKVKNGPLNWISSLKGKFFIAARKIVPEADFGVLAGLMFGDRDFMDAEEYEEFQENGIAHVLAVSGLHVSMVYELIIRLLGGKRNKGTTILMLMSLFAYAALANFSVSVMRAALMICIRLMAFHLERRYDLVSAASLAAIILTAINPYQLLDSGFQLSFTAAYTMGICLPWATVKVKALADKYRREWIEKIGDAVLPAVLIQLGMMPLTMYHFCLISPIAILLNPFAIFLAGLILAAGLAMFLIFALLGDGLLFAGAAGPAQYLCRALALLNAAGARARGGFAAAAPPLAAVIVYYFMLFYFFSETRYVLCRRNQNSASLTLAIVLVAAACLVPWTMGLAESPLPWKYNDYPLVFLDVGQGDSIHINIDGKNILVDGGGTWGGDIAKKTLRPYLLKNGVSKLDLAIVTHSDLDHSKGIQQLSQLMEIDSIAFPLCYRGDEERLSPYITENRIFMACGDELRISEDACIRVLSPSGKHQVSEDENDNCLVMVLCFKGMKILLTSDLPEAGELQLLRKYPELIDCDVIKLAHHGSSTSSSRAFMTGVSPSFAVISVGRGNSYGHPHAAVIDLLEKSDIIYGRTDESGAICLTSVTEEHLEFVNAAKDRRWLIPRETNRQENIRQRR